MISYGCTYCDRRWPDTGQALVMCPCCREPLLATELPPCDYDDAPFPADRAAKLKAEFDMGWWLWDTQRL